MSIPLSRYNTIRTRLIELYNILNNRSFDVWVTPAMLMSLEELRDREEYSQEGFVGDPNYYNEYQVRRMNVPRIIDILPNLSSEKDLGFREPQIVIPLIYESIQEYICLWCELFKKAPEFPTPSIDELRKLELLAYTLFNFYKRIKPYLDKKKLRELGGDVQEIDKRNLMQLSALFSINAMGTPKAEISFVSHLDELFGDDTLNPGLSLSEQPYITNKAVADSLAAQDTPEDLGPWLFNKPTGIL